MRVLFKCRQLRNEEIVAGCDLDGDKPLWRLYNAGHAAIAGGSRPSEKKRAGHEPSVNVIRLAGGIFAPISQPVQCCDDEATREEEEFREVDLTAGKEKGPRKPTRKTSELSTMGLVAEDEATVEPSSRDHTCRICPHNGQVQNVGSESSDLFRISTDKILAKLFDNPVPVLMHGIGTESIFASTSSRSLQPSGSTRHSGAHRGVPWMCSRVMTQTDLLPTCRWVGTYQFDQQGDCSG